MEFKYFIPDITGNRKEVKTNFNSLIIIGANGSGKSKLGAWIEQQDMEKVHRIGAQRNLNFHENVPLKNYSQAESFVFYGTDIQEGKRHKNYRWNWGKEYTTKLIDDFDNVLAALIALKNNDNDKFIQQYKEAVVKHLDIPAPPLTVIDKLKLIWNEIFPHRQLEIDDAKFYALLQQSDGSFIRYSSTQMSDGERAVLYLASQVFCVPNNKILIIDEPEVHLHHSIMNRLWGSLEKCRPDCFFIYITHDTQFAATHIQSDKIWIKEFDGKNWQLEVIRNNELPEELLFDILGSRKNVLFVEGEKNSYDTQLYTAIYPNYHIIACGSCTQVIARTKAFRCSTSLHHCEVYGLIDCDYRSDYEINKYKENYIYTINVAEVENLFLVEELIRSLASYLGKNADDVFSKIKNYLINDRFAKQIDKQICKSVIACLKYQLSSIDISSKNNDAAKTSLDVELHKIDYAKTENEQTLKFENALRSASYADVLRVFNEKNLINSVGHFFGLDNKAYCSTILNLLNGNMHNEIINAISKYLPAEIPR